MLTKLPANVMGVNCNAHAQDQLEILKCWLDVPFGVLTLPYSHTVGYKFLANVAPDRCLLFICVQSLAGLVPSFKVKLQFQDSWHCQVRTPSTSLDWPQPRLA